MASPGNQHCAKCIDTLSFPIVSGPRTVFSADHTNPNLSRTLLEPPPIFFLLSVYNLYLAVYSRLCTAVGGARRSSGRRGADAADGSF